MFSEGRYTRNSLVRRHGGLGSDYDEVGTGERPQGPPSRPQTCSVSDAWAYERRLVESLARYLGEGGKTITTIKKDGNLGEERTHAIHLESQFQPGTRCGTKEEKLGNKQQRQKGKYNTRRTIEGKRYASGDPCTGRGA